MTIACTLDSPQTTDTGERLRIALINQPYDSSLPPKQTSLAIWSYQVAQRLAGDCDVTVYGRSRGDGPSEETVDGVRYVHVPNRFDRRVTRWLERLTPRRPITKPHASSRWYGIEYARTVAADLRKSRCDLALVFNYSQFAPILKKMNPRTHIVLDMQCEWASQFDRAMIGSRLDSVDTVVGCSAYIANKVRERYPQYPGDCQALYNGVDSAHFADACVAPEARGERKQILFVGRISPEKGLHVLIDAFAKVLKRVPDAKLDLVGAAAQCPREILVDLSDEPTVRDLARFYDDRTYQQHLEARIAELDIGEHVTFSGFLAHAETLKHFDASAILTNPSLSEAFGMSLAEGMAAGLPVVATRVGGMVEVVDDGVTGLLVPPDDADALADALGELLLDRQKRSAMGVAGQARAAREFSWERIAGDLRAIATQAVKERAGK